MSEGRNPDRAAFSQKSAEIVVAALFFFLGALVMFDSTRLGMGWHEVHGPESGYFPFYVGLIIAISSLVNIGYALVVPAVKARAFVQVGQLRLVLTVLVPTALYAAAVSWIGIYVSSAVFIAFFMRWLGKYPWWKAVCVSLGATVVFYVIFEIWFKVPLPKGPLESFLRLD